MINAFRHGKPLPKLFRDDFSDEKKLQQLITNMCAFKDKDRTSIEDVKSWLWKLYGMTKCTLYIYINYKFSVKP